MQILVVDIHGADFIAFVEVDVLGGDRARNSVGLGVIGERAIGIDAENAGYWPLIDRVAPSDSYTLPSQLPFIEA